ncbi:MAG: hypothetical protein IJ252_11890 [Solobacterium sp.]|nr:hypothetical protein [Solobacterium sp.]
MKKKILVTLCVLIILAALVAVGFFDGSEKLTVITSEVNSSTFVDEWINRRLPFHYRNIPFMDEEDHQITTSSYYAKLRVIGAGFQF